MLLFLGDFFLSFIFFDTVMTSGPVGSLFLEESLLSILAPLMASSHFQDFYFGVFFSATLLISLEMLIFSRALSIS